LNKPEIILLTVVEEPLDATSVDENSFDKWRSKRDDDLKEAAQWVASNGLNVDALLAVGDPRKMILEAATMKDPDLLVISRRGSGGTEKMVLGSVASYILKHAQCPVMVL
jgi:nucleotide-binding universal stress UspA family protein